MTYKLLGQGHRDYPTGAGAGTGVIRDSAAALALALSSGQQGMGCSRRDVGHWCSGPRALVQEGDGRLQGRRDQQHDGELARWFGLLCHHPQVPASVDRL